MVLALENVENKKEMVRCWRRAVLPCKVVWGPPLSIRNGGSTRKPSHTAAKKSTSRLFMQFCLGTPNSATFYQNFLKKNTQFLHLKKSNMYQICIKQLANCVIYILTDQQIEIASSAFSNFSCSTNSASISTLGDETLNIFSLYFFILLRQSSAFRKTVTGQARLLFMMFRNHVIEGPPNAVIGHAYYYTSTQQLLVISSIFICARSSIQAPTSTYIAIFAR